MKLHIIFVVLHILAVLLSMGLGLIITVPIHIILAFKRNKKKAAEAHKRALDELSGTPKDDEI
jgi:hypothetical protein